MPSCDSTRAQGVSACSLMRIANAKVLLVTCPPIAFGAAPRSSRLDRHAHASRVLLGQGCYKAVGQLDRVQPGGCRCKTSIDTLGFKEQSAKSPAKVRIWTLSSPSLAHSGVVGDLGSSSLRMHCPIGEADREKPQEQPHLSDHADGSTNRSAPRVSIPHCKTCRL